MSAEPTQNDQPDANGLYPAEAEYLQTTAYTQRLDRRALRLNTLLGRSSATVLEILCADLGTRSPNGLDLQPIEDFEINIGTINGPGDPDRNSKLSKNVEGSLGYAPYSSPTVLLRKDLMESASDPESKKTVPSFFPGSTFSHEVTHRLQMREISLLKTSPLYKNSFTNPVLELPSLLSKESYKGQSLWARFNRCAKNFNAVKKGHSWWSLAGEDLKSIWNRANIIPHYLANDMELQARLHQTLSAGYTVWQRMPATKTELHAALYNCGAKVSGAVLFTLHATPEGREAVKTFAVPAHIKPYAGHVMKDINLVFDYATTSKAQDNFWRYSIPALYGNLLELYGDTLGRERMELGKNRNEILNVFRVIEKEPSDPEKLRETLLAVSPENVTELATFLIFLSGELNPQNDLASRALDILLENPATRVAITNPNEIINYGKVTTLPPLTIAIVNGRSVSIQKLVAAGADPFHKTKIINLLNNTFYNYESFSDIADRACALGMDNNPQFLKTLWVKYTKAHRAPLADNIRKGLNTLNECPEIDRHARHLVRTASDQPAIETSFHEIMDKLGFNTPKNQPDPPQYKGVEIPGHF